MTVEVKVRIPAIEKLLDYSASGIGSVAGPMLASWKARQEAKAKAIAADGEAAARRILVEGEADTLTIIATAQADARSILVSPDSEIQGQLDFGHTVTQRLQFQEEKRQRNIESVVRHAASHLGDKHVENHEPDHDWTARFFSDIKDVSAREAQRIYARILAGEVERPGSTSAKTLGILRDIDRSTAALFKILRSASIALADNHGRTFDARVPSLGGDASQNALQKFGLSFDDLNVLNEHGLIIADYRSWYEFRLCMSIAAKTQEQEALMVRFPFSFQDRYWVLESTKPRGPDAIYRLSGVALTRAGRELSRVVECEIVPGYHQALEKFFATQGLVMTEVDGASPQIVKGDSA